MTVAHDIAVNWPGARATPGPADRLGKLVELQGREEWEGTTDHALLVVLGEFARHFTLVNDEDWAAKRGRLVPGGELDNRGAIG